MFYNKKSISFYIIVALAVFGIFSTLLTNPFTLFTYLLITIGIAVVVISLVYLLFKFANKTSDNRTDHEAIKYKRAVKKSKMKYANSEQKKGKYKSKLNMSKKRPTHLKLISKKK